jgi:AraC family transcriptional activator of mtrCDE
MPVDLLSRLLLLTPVSGHIDVRCHFGAPWRLEESEAGPNEIAYHVLLSGSAIVEDAHFAPAQLGPGDILLFPRGSAHRLHDGSGRKPRPAQRRQSDSLTIAVNGGKGETADVLCGRFVLGAGADRLLRDYLPQRLVVRSAAATGEGAEGANAPTRLARLIQLMREETLEEGPGSESLVSHLSAALFALTLRFASHGAEAPHGLLALAQRTRLQPAVEAMFDAPQLPWNLPELAALCHMSRATFARHFAEAIGRTASEVLTEIRMTLAGRQLVQTTRSVAAVGEEVGYQSDAAFQRVFKRYHGITPSRWRAAHGRPGRED